MEKLTSSFKNMVLSLTLISLVAAGALAAVFIVTEKPIEAQKEAKQSNAIGQVLPKVEDYVIADAKEISDADGNTYIVHEAYSNNELIGAAIETQSNGFGGTIRLMVGFDAEGKIINYEVLEQQETPGLGTHIVEWFKTDKNNQSICGLNPQEKNLTVKKDGGDVDAITAATISSRAFLKAVRGAYNAYFNAQPAVEATSGASCLNDSTQQAKNDTINPVNTEINE